MSENSLLPVPFPPNRRPFWTNPWFWVALAAVGLAAWQWLETRSRLVVTQQEVAKRLADNDLAVKENRVLASRALEQTADLQGKLGAVESRLAEFQGQAAALQSLYQETALSRDDALLAEVEQGVSIAAQQLQLAGNVQAAIAVLQTADARLARLDRPQFHNLRKTLNRDLERLRATPFVDVPGMNLRLENVILGVDKLPLMLDLLPRRPAPEPVLADQPAPTWWQAWLGDAWREIRGLVRIQRFDRQETVLLTPDQGAMLRENIKLRLLNARLALLSRDQWTFRNELKAAHAWLERYFNTEEKSVQASLAALKQLSATDITFELPSLNDTLTALQNLKASRERR